ncbi:MAG: hypothetical protein KC425_01430 [Anaerolineales bacterium]|nr:hypothetical protein [Anaerolineales bacterium]
MKRVGLSFVFMIALISFWGVQSAFAAPLGYIDPNTGGMLFQILAVAVTLLSGVLFFFSSRIKMGVARLRRYFRGDEADIEGEAE